MDCCGDGKESTGKKKDSSKVLGMKMDKAGIVLSVDKGCVARQCGIKVDDRIKAIAGMDVKVTAHSNIECLLPYDREMVIDFARKEMDFEAVFELTKKEIQSLVGPRGRSA